ncbi:MAG: head-tail connector protein, partial [bacterium]
LFGLVMILQMWGFGAHNWKISLPDRKCLGGPDVLVRYPGCSIKEMKLARTPLISVDAVKVAGSNGLMEDIAPALYQIESVGQTVFLRNAYGADLPNPTKDRFGIRVDATIGFGDTPSTIPPTLRQAILLLVASYYENRGKGDLDMPQSVKTLLSPWREVKI